MWAFEVTPIELPEIYWSHSLEEIRVYSRLRLSWFQAQAFQQHQVMRIIMEQAFGSSKETASQHEPKNKEEAKSMLAGLFKK
jgi:hypothetical protein